MLFSQNRAEIRKFYFETWKKRCEGAPMEPMETLVSDVIANHPEYHKLLENEEANLDKDYAPENGETNPFLHMSLHIAIAEQRATNQPRDINTVYQKIAAKTGDPHEAEHQMMECLVEMMWKMQRENRNTPDEKAYVTCLKKRAGMK